MFVIFENGKFKTQWNTDFRDVAKPAHHQAQLAFSKRLPTSLFLLEISAGFTVSSLLASDISGQPALSDIPATFPTTLNAISLHVRASVGYFHRLRDYT